MKVRAFKALESWNDSMYVKRSRRPKLGNKFPSVRLAPCSTLTKSLMTEVEAIFDHRIIAFNWAVSWAVFHNNSWPALHLADFNLTKHHPLLNPLISYFLSFVNFNHGESMCAHGFRLVGALSFMLSSSSLKLLGRRPTCT